MHPTKPAKHGPSTKQCNTIPEPGSGTVHHKQNGNSIIMVSSELPEILGMSDRIVVMHEGKTVATLNGAETTEVDVLHHAMGGK